jgi:hypothetical protein
MVGAWICCRALEVFMSDAENILPSIYTPPKDRRVVRVQELRDGEQPKVHISDVVLALNEHFGGEHD